MIQTLYPPFRRWTEKGTLWVYSDPHYSDPDMKELRTNYIGDEEQVKRINSKVGKYDTIIFLGDIGNEDMVRKVRGYKVLIMGNHDKGASNYTDIFDEVYEGPLFIAEKLILSHEPIDLPFAFNIHGHEHRYILRDHHLNVCAEHIDYTPVNVNRLIKNGSLSLVESIHRITIDRAVYKKRAAVDSQNRKKLLKECFTVAKYALLNDIRKEHELWMRYQETGKDEDYKAWRDLRDENKGSGE